MGKAVFLKGDFHKKEVVTLEVGGHLSSKVPSPPFLPATNDDG